MNTCVLCERPTDSRLCGSCWSNFETGLRQVPMLTDELRSVLMKSTRYGNGGIGFVSRGSDEQPLVVDFHASELADELRVTLGTWVRALHEESCIRWEECHVCSARWFGGDRHHNRKNCHGVWIEMYDPLVVHDNSVELAAWILRHQSWVRNHSAVDELVEQIIDVIRSVWRSIDTTPAKQIAGTCGYEGCQERLFGHESRALVVCRACGAKHVLGDRRTTLLIQVEDELVELRELAGIIVNADGKNVSSSTIRNLKHRGRIVAKVNDNGTIRPRIPEDEGPELFLVRDVIDAVLDRYKHRKRAETVTCA